MFFPYTSSYMHLFRRNGMRSPFDLEQYTDPSGGPYSSYGMKPMDVPGDDEDFRGFGSSSGSADPDKSTRRRTLGAGLSALGVGLLESAGTGDWTGGLARGMAGFAQATAAEKEQARRERMEEEERQYRQRQDSRAEEQERDRNQSHDLDVRRANSEYDAWNEQQERGKQTRARVGKSAEQMAADIEAMAASKPDDPKLQSMAKRAAGYALGEDSDLNKLADLYDDMVSQRYLDEDYDRQTKAEIRRDKARIDAKVETDPAAAERRANEQLEISRGHLSNDRERLNVEKNRPTPLQVYDRLEKRVAEKLEAKVSAYRENRGMEPMPGQIEQWRQEAIREAQAEFERSMGSVMRYTATGELIQEP